VRGTCKKDLGTVVARLACHLCIVKARIWVDDEDRGEEEEEGDGDKEVEDEEQRILPDDAEEPREVGVHSNVSHGVSVRRSGSEDGGEA
jgi:hypothetical protein